MFFKVDRYQIKRPVPGFGWSSRHKHMACVFKLGQNCITIHQQGRDPLSPQRIELVRDPCGARNTPALRHQPFGEVCRAVAVAKRK